ncbi:hypothetical protein CDCA_CDCA05G1673 [Cyanidium caldarium]|uniref:Uncharacterized protein n=1 Tax=Cyanidium caldarium TaxID=2771 RepID=A0AAV9ITP1_CYACA|nr:hypothetical protein CDCA_CDCA05G1673 [Cyanidium caldarium]
MFLSGWTIRGAHPSALRHRHFVSAVSTDTRWRWSRSPARRTAHIPVSMGAGWHSGEPPFPLSDDEDERRRDAQRLGVEPPVPPPTIPTLGSSSGTALLEAETAWLIDEVRRWLDTEWEELTVHEEIAKAAAAAAIYYRWRMEAEREPCDVGSLVLAVSTELLAGPHFQVDRETWQKAYVNNFNVGNRVGDLYMIRFHADDDDDDDGDGREDGQRASNDVCQCAGISVEDAEAILQRARERGLAVGKEPPVMPNPGPPQPNPVKRAPRPRSQFRTTYSKKNTEFALQTPQDAFMREAHFHDVMRMRRMVRERGLYGDLAEALDTERAEAKYPTSKEWMWAPEPPDAKSAKGDEEEDEEEEQESPAPDEIPVDVPFDAWNVGVQDIHEFDRHLFFMYTLYGDLDDVVINRVVNKTAEAAGHQQLLQPRFEMRDLITDDASLTAEQLASFAVDLATDALVAERRARGQPLPQGEELETLRKKTANDLDTLVETTYGEELMRMALEEQDPDFAMRSAVVKYLLAVNWTE